MDTWAVGVYVGRGSGEGQGAEALQRKTTERAAAREGVPAASRQYATLGRCASAAKRRQQQQRQHPSEPAPAPAERPRGWHPWRGGVQTSWPCCAACSSPACRLARGGGLPSGFTREGFSTNAAPGWLPVISSCCNPSPRAATLCSNTPQPHPLTCGSAGTAAQSTRQSSRRTPDGTCRSALPAARSTCGEQERYTRAVHM